MSANYVHNEVVKSKERDKVLELLTEHHDPIPAKIFSLPHDNWNFETQIIQSSPNKPATQLVTAECITDVYRRAVTNFDAFCKCWYGPLDHYNQRVGNRLFRMAETEHGNVRFYRADLLKLATLALESHNGSRVFSSEFGGWTACWLDLCSQLCDKYLSILEHIPYLCSHLVKKIPIVMTFMLGREADWVKTLFESDDKFNSRADVISDLLAVSPGFKWKELDRWSYKSGRRLTKTIGSVAGYLERK